MHLHDYLQSEATRKWSWGTANCCLFAADWIRAVTGKDIAAGWRGRVQSDAEARQAMTDEGGIEAFARRAMSCFDPTDDPQTGDVGLIPTADGPLCAIRSGRLWLARTPDGIGGLKVKAIAAWRIG